ncbi:phage portal protein [Streptosporangium sp. NPDC048865]|uniref:phage portal protein n=1 Tax=Streptosporangium sp. NPDC048865 TaxID=3155766 RepID=UPI00344A9C78
MNLLQRAIRGRKSWSETPFWDPERLRYPLYGSISRADREQIEHDFEGYVAGIYKRNGPVFSLMMVRQLVFSEARFKFRSLSDGRPGKLFGKPALERLERPWTNGTTGDLLSRMLQDADLAGNAFHAFHDGRIRRLRPDRVTIVLGSRSQPDLDMPAGFLPLDVEVAGYIYSPTRLGTDDDLLLLPSQVSHFAPIPDPEAHYRGMSWLTPVIREISADSAATLHKKKFFDNAATPNLAVALKETVTPQQFREFMAEMNAAHQGVDNAYKTMYVGGGADVTVVGADLKQLDFRGTQSAGESRLAAAAGVPPVIVGFSEGLGGSSLNEGNFKAARRRFVDATMRPLWRNAAGSLASLVDVPSDAELWFDTRDIAFLRDDSRDIAQIQFTQAQTIRQYVDAGFKPDSVVAAVEAEDMTLLRHSGLYSVQLQKPGASTAPTTVDPEQEQ